MMSIARIYAGFDRSFASLAFKDAVRQFNALDKAPSTYTWQQRVDADVLSRDFSLRAKFLLTDVGDAVEELAREENSDLYSDVLVLKDEGLKARSLLRYLKTLFSHD